MGFLIAKSGFQLVNGGYGGTMLASAKGAKEAGGHTLGVTTDQFPDSKANPFIDEEMRKQSWSERMHELIARGDGFVVLDGGTGTLAELSVIWEMERKGLHSKPASILGKNMQLVVSTLIRNPDIELPGTFAMVTTPEAAVDHLRGYF